MLTMQGISDGAATLLRQIGRTEQPALDAIPGGANNRVFRVRAGGDSYFLKSYARHPDDPHNRLAHDWQFASLAWNQGLRTVARPLAKDDDQLLGLFEFVEGRRLAPYDIDEGIVTSAATFFASINELRKMPEAAAIPDGFGAQFSIDGWLRVVDARVAELATIAPSSPASEAALSFVAGIVSPLWERTRSTVEGKVDASERNASLPREGQCLSPVDFGFHNVLMRTDGVCVFHDFEYAGWDDPARMACEFFCQLQSSAPRELAGTFLETAFAKLSDIRAILARATTLWPVFRVLWCCRVLNDFLPAAVTRQQYAGQPPSELRKTRQLEMARMLIDRPLNDVPW
ncbi:MAG: phosphotransferase [Planctomycetaceae bacterium]|nr:phosphotransferase [Planctomycetaceae bacterium]